MEDNQPTMVERIAQRRAVLEAKMKAKKSNQGDSAGQEDTESAQKGKGEEQVRASRRQLAALKSDAEHAITKFRVETDTQENERRLRENAQCVARGRKTEDESSSSFKRHGAIQLKFESLFTIKTPQELQQEMELQRDACRRVIEVKDKLIEEFRDQMREKEEEYVHALKRHSSDIDRLLSEMHAKTDVMVTNYGRELKGIEAAYNDERREMLEKFSGEIDQLMVQRANKQRDYTRKRENRVWEAQETLDSAYEQKAEMYNKCKMDNQHDIHGLEQELEKCKADYMLNAERLNYNLQVLRERVKENKNAQNQHKRKLTRLQDVLSSHISRYNETNNKFKAANAELTESYRRVTEQYKDLQLKFQHFEKADAEKHQQVWNMHEADCMKLVHKCLQGDRIVFEELLGVPWAPPSLDFWVHADEGERSDGEEEEEKEVEEDTAKIELGDMAHSMLEVLYAQVPFLIEERAQTVIEELEAAPNHAVKIDHILETLGVQKTEQVNEMLEYFTFEGDEGHAAALINPQEAVRALHAFLEERRKRQATKLELSKTESSAVSDETKKEIQRKKGEREFWERMTNVIPPAHMRVWDALEGGLEKYHGQLQTRNKLIEETDAIRKQNDELRALLNQYLGSRINKELFAPPQLQVVGSGQQQQ